MIKLSEYAKKHGVTRKTAWNHFKRGLIEGAYQLPSGTIVVPDSYSVTPRSETLSKPHGERLLALVDNFAKELSGFRDEVCASVEEKKK